MVLIGTLWAIFHPREPRYGGKPLTSWLEVLLLDWELATQTDAAKQEAQQAITTIGTNGIPIYLRLLKENDSKLRLKWNAAFDWIKDNYAFKIHHLRDYERNCEGYLGIKTLGTNAVTAVPELVRIYKLNISDNSRSAVIMSLGEIGPPAKDAVPFLLQWLSERPKEFEVIQALGKIHSSPDLVIPVLIDHLADSDQLARVSTLKALGEFGADAKSAFEPATKLLNDEKASVRDSARETLKKIDPVATARIAK